VGQAVALPRVTVHELALPAHGPREILLDRMIEGSGAETMDGETQTTRTDAAPPLPEAQHLSPSGDNADRNSPTHGLRARVNAVTVNGVGHGRSNPGLIGTRHTLTPA
jgi:hypothetical protein